MGERDSAMEHEHPSGLGQAFAVPSADFTHKGSSHTFIRESTTTLSLPIFTFQTPLESLIMGGLSKILASLVTYPSQVR